MFMEVKPRADRGGSVVCVCVCVCVVPLGVATGWCGSSARMGVDGMSAVLDANDEVELVVEELTDAMLRGEEELPGALPEGGCNVCVCVCVWLCGSVSHDCPVENCVTLCYEALCEADAGRRSVS